jgi:hypothetical protein
MATLDTITIRRLSENDWDYMVELGLRPGGTVAFTASVEDLDRISAAIDEQLLLMVEAAERMESGG